MKKEGFAEFADTHAPDYIFAVINKALEDINPDWFEQTRRKHFPTTAEMEEDAKVAAGGTPTPAVTPAPTAGEVK